MPAGRASFAMLNVQDNIPNIYFSSYKPKDW